MAKTYTEITDEITALDCPITKAKIQILYQDILDFANENTSPLIGGFVLGDVGNGSGALSTFGICTSATKNSGANRSQVDISFNDLGTNQYMIITELEYISNNNNDTNVVITGNKTNNSCIFIFDETAATPQYLKVTFQIIKY